MCNSIIIQVTLKFIYLVDTKVTCHFSSSSKKKKTKKVTKESEQNEKNCIAHR